MTDYINSRGAVLSVSGKATKGFVGTANTELLTGTDGNDRIRGVKGPDTYQGGKGDDTYFLSNASDTVVEKSGEGVDTVVSITKYK